MSQAASYKLLAARVLIVVIFLMAGIQKLMKFGGTAEMLAGKGIPLATVALGIAALMEIVGGLSVLLGYKTKLGSRVLIVYLVPVTLIMHNFWAAEQFQTQFVAFMKNLAIMGGLIALSIAGPGEYAVDSSDSSGGDVGQSEPAV